MRTIFYIIIIVLATWLMIDNIYREYIYSPKAQIKRLWKEIFNLAHQIGEYKNLIFDDKFINEFDDETKKIFKDPAFIREHAIDDFGGWARVLERAISKRKKVIKTLLNYHFDPEADEEYIKDNKPQKDERDLEKERIINEIIKKKFTEKSTTLREMELLTEIKEEIKLL